MLPRKQLPVFRTQEADKENICFLTEGLNLAAIFLEVGDDNGTLAQNMLGDLKLKLFDEAQWEFTADLRHSRPGLRFPDLWQPRHGRLSDLHPVLA
jgi:hypothetical protein